MAKNTVTKIEIKCDACGVEIPPPRFPMCDADGFMVEFEETDSGGYTTIRYLCPEHMAMLDEIRVFLEKAMHHRITSCQLHLSDWGLKNGAL